MRRPALAGLCLGLWLVAGCRIEDHTPTGSRRDEAAVLALVSRYERTFSSRDWNGARALFWADAIYSGPMLLREGSTHQAVPIELALGTIARRVEGFDPARFGVRVLRSDYRQDGELAAVWLTTRRLTPVAGSVSDDEWIEHLVLRRIKGEWRILSLAATASPGSETRGSR